MRVWLAHVTALVLLAAPSGCATERLLTPEQEEEMRKTCAEAGCAVVDKRVWHQIQEILKSLGILGENI